MKSKENHSQSPLLSAHIKTGFYVILPCMAGAFSISFNSLHYMIFFFMSVLDSLSLSYHFFSFLHSASLDTLTLLLLIFRGHRLYKKIKMKKKWKRKTCCKASACLNENLNILYDFFSFLSYSVSELAVLCIPPARLFGWDFFFRFWINFGLELFCREICLIILHYLYNILHNYLKLR